MEFAGYCCHLPTVQWWVFIITEDYVSKESNAVISQSPSFGRLTASRWAIDLPFFSRSRILLHAASVFPTVESFRVLNLGQCRH
jgi:hypothetical protein